MRTTFSLLTRNSSLRFCTSLLLIVLLVGCDKDDSSSVGQPLNDELIGEWTLTRTIGGFVGEINYTKEDSPECITFDGSEYVRLSKPDAISQGAYQVQNVVIRNDTTFFDFGDESQSVFNGQDVQLVESRFLETMDQNFFSFRYEKL